MASVSLMMLVTRSYLLSIVYTPQTPTENYISHFVMSLHCISCCNYVASNGE